LIRPPGKIIAGEIIFEGSNLLKKSEEEMRAIRGSKISMCFQDPMTYLNPVMKIGEQIAEPLILHQKLSRSEAEVKAIEMLSLVGIPHSLERVKDYPHQLSGGMRQRILLAMALSCNPQLLIADEPTTALDVIVQGQILRLIKNLQKKLMNSLLFITHDMGIVAHLCERVVVMYAGRIMEYADVESMFENPLHPYTRALIDSIPKIGMKRFQIIDGMTPNPLNLPTGCRFHPRCPYATDRCIKEEPALYNVRERRLISCFQFEG
jgi:oligopeptide/dipeptide ABC transporter ATP-binding protein